MIKKILPVITSSKKHRIAKWHDFLESLADKHIAYREKYQTTQPAITSPVFLFFTRLLINLADVIEPMLEMDDLDACSYLLDSHRQTELVRYLDPIKTIECHRRLFVRKSSTVPTTELIVPVSTDDPLRQLPVFNGTTEEWKETRAVRIWYHDGLGYPDHEGGPFLIPRAQTTFLKQPPTIMLLTVDMTIVMLKLLRYLRHNILNHVDFYKLHLPYFVYEELLIDLDADLKSIWVHNLIQALYDCHSTVAVDALLPQISSTRSLNQNIKIPCYALFYYLQDIKYNRLPIESLFNSRIYYGKQCLIDRAKLLLDWLVVPQLKQYAHIDLALQLPILTQVIETMAVSSDPGKTRTVKADLHKFVTRLYNNRVTQQFETPILRNWATEQLTYSLLM